MRKIAQTVGFGGFEFFVEMSKPAEWHKFIKERLPVEEGIEKPGRYYFRSFREVPYRKIEHQKQAEANNLAIQQAQLAELQKANILRRRLIIRLTLLHLAPSAWARPRCKGKVPNQFLLPIRNQISGSFDQSRRI